MSVKESDTGGDDEILTVPFPPLKVERTLIGSKAISEAEEVDYTIVYASIERNDDSLTDAEV